MCSKPGFFLLGKEKKIAGTAQRRVWPSGQCSTWARRRLFSTISKRYHSKAGAAWLGCTALSRTTVTCVVIRRCTGRAEVKLLLYRSLLASVSAATVLSIGCSVSSRMLLDKQLPCFYPFMLSNDKMLNKYTRLLWSPSVSLGCVCLLLLGGCREGLSFWAHSCRKNMEHQLET